MDRLRRMEIFVAVAETGQFTRAARTLNLSKSAVTHAVSDLEDYLGVQLIIRDNRNFELTNAGGDYLEQCIRSLSDIGELEDSTRNIHHAISGRIRINSPITYGAHVLAPVLSAFMRENPNIEIILDLTDRFVDLVQEGGDLVIRIAELPDSSMIARRLSSIRMCLCASPPFAKANPIQQLEDLHKLACFTYLGAPTWRVMDGDKEVKFTPKGPMKSNSGEAIRELAIAGSGVAYLPDFMVEKALADKQLRQVLPSYTGKIYHVYACFPLHRHQPLRVRRLIDFIAKGV